MGERVVAPRVVVVLLLVSSVAILAPATHAAVPGEVDSISIAADRVSISWAAEPQTDTYTLYRGYVRDLADDFYGTFYDAEIVPESYVDETEPVEGTAFFYLVTARNLDGEGTLGFAARPDGSAPERPNSYPWPGWSASGRWEGFRSWPVQAVHSSVLHTGDVLTWGFGSVGTTTNTYLWDPVADQFTLQIASPDLFCSGHTLLADGRLLVIGGRGGPSAGHDESNYFDPVTATWSDGPSMSQGRWYPTGILLADESVITLSGLLDTGARNRDVERYTGGGSPGWTLLPGAEKELPSFPRLHLLPDGKLLLSGPRRMTETLDPSTETWTQVGNTAFGWRGDSNSILLPPGHEKVLLVGGYKVVDGEEQATNTAEILDMSAAMPAWVSADPMRFPRQHSNAVILPDGDVLLAGGGYNDDIPAYPSEIFDTATETWTVVASQRSFRLYHSTAVLLPDARVMWAGSDGNNTAEFYEPGYLFRGPRPMITSVPSSASYGSSFTLQTPDAANIASVVAIRPGTVTHSVNFDQRYVPLAFSVAGGSSLNVTVPSNASVAPPGYYMIFILDANDVPSEARFMRFD